MTHDHIDHFSFIILEHRWKAPIQFNANKTQWMWPEDNMYMTLTKIYLCHRVWICDSSNDPTDYLILRFCFAIWTICHIVLPMF